MKFFVHFFKFFFVYMIGSYLNPLFAEGVPHDGRFERAEFVASLIKKGDVGAEIGVSLGVFAYHVLLQNQPSKLYLIDPWEYGLQRDVEINPTFEKQILRDLDYEAVCKLFAPYSNIKIIREKSEDAVTHFPNDFFDYVYIDGEHSYEAIKRDLSNYFPKIKIGGYLIGDDYGWAGIAIAVQEFLSEHRDELFWLVDPYSGKSGGQFAIRRLR